ncbi:NitT/TauT family transport system permease protein [Enhydrobacter aerosaccus]|uniref:NitT/TauT family transport system permease protein n=1 Tax=Enhydrobacter aerosaccus TaxID=225324 RepID=A0A1T4JKU8_9HYPH|nr:ABC transporter permease [Enhydrobacter aerosaccus]SJZ30707.1 NitT/TauT family transport system permease protein [Enhydrobacter aerosaccus]
MTVIDTVTATAARAPVRLRLVTLDRLRSAALPIGFAAAVLLLWQVAVDIGGYPKVILPAPSDIASALAANFSEICRQAVPTTRDTLAGFCIAAVLGIGLASLLTVNRLLRDAIYPLVIVIQLVPKIAWTPLFIVWAGIGWPSRLTIATFIAFFPIFMAMLAGLESTDGSLVRLCRALTATPWRTFWLVRFPASMPYLFSGLKIGITLSVIGVVVAEFISSSEGLGFFILKSAALLQTDVILAAILVLCLVGLASFGLVHLGELAVRRWRGD